MACVSKSDYKRPGYYVEGRYFGDKFSQACARAKFLSAEYGRPVEVRFLAHEDAPNQAAWAAQKVSADYGVVTFDQTQCRAP